ncbi:conserved hypothetical protein [Vibrio coralliirubri]|nr:conserved hypothetical protein [Vibrio coralliirubri]
MILTKKENTHLNQFLTSLFSAIAININHLQYEYLSKNELNHLNKTLRSEDDLNHDFYTSQHGENLECLLFFLDKHRDIIIALMRENASNQTLTCLYTSYTISGSYDCFRFDLSKFPQTYIPKNQVITLYRVGRCSESASNLGCSWASSIEGLNTYCDRSALSKDVLKSRPIFIATIDDSQVLFEGDSSETELVLKHDFTLKNLSLADEEVRKKIGR